MRREQGHHPPGGPGRDRQDRERQQHNPELSSDDKQKILAGDAATIDEVAERFAKGLKNLNRTQMRNFYTPFTRIRASRETAERKKAVIQHRARLAYLVAREPRAKPIWELFEGLLKSVGQEQSANQDKQSNQIDALCDLAEALIAYHYRESKSGGGDREQRLEE